MASVLAAALTTTAYGVLAVALWMAAASDLARRIVPNACPAAVALAALARLAGRVLRGRSVTGDLIGALAGTLVVLAVLLASATLFARARGDPGVGGGDVKLLSAAGAWLGPVDALACVALSCVVALLGRLVTSLVRRVRRLPAASAGMPLAPAIAVSTLALVLLGS